MNNLDKHIAEGTAEHALASRRYASSSVKRSQIRRMIALEVVTDPALFGAARLSKLAEQHKVKQREMLMRAPRDAIIAIEPISAGSESSEAVLLLPALSHVRAPVRPGELVLALFEDPDDSGSVGFWLSRMPSVGFVDDPNVMHHIREHDPAFYISDDQSRGAEHHFSNGARTSDGLTIGETAQLAGGAAAFEALVTGSFAGALRVIEPVGRHKRRVDDLLLEGARGAYVSIGSERSGPAYDSEQFQKLPEDAPRSAAVIVAVGTGRSERTAVSVVNNTLGFEEAAKDRVAAGESDPDIESDATTLHASQRCDADKLLNLSSAPVDIPSREAAVMAIKSDDMRLVARRSVRLIALGSSEADDGTLADKPDEAVTCELAMSAVKGDAAVKVGRDLSMHASRDCSISGKQLKFVADESAVIDAKKLTMCGSEHPAPAFDRFSAALASTLEDLVKALSAGTAGTPAAHKLNGAEAFALSAAKLIAELRAASKSAGTLVSTKIKHG